MSLFETINGLQVEQLASVAETLNIAKGKGYDFFTETYKKTHLKKKIKSKLAEFYTSRQKVKPLESHEIIALWRDYILEILEKKKVKPENQIRKENAINDLKSLNSKARPDDSDSMISIVRDILLLLWEESSDKQKERFIDIVKKDLEKHNQKFTEEELRNSLSYLLFGGIGGAVPFAIPLAAGVMLQQLTRGFIAWFLINIMGQRALQVAVAGALAGPIGWGIAIGAGGLGIALSLLKFGSERDKLRFIQTILSIYAFSFQNKLNQRRKEGQPI
jgi:hypothetical protein